ncbi:MULTISPECIES: chromate transporter [Fusobacterium]|uniref:chromate transporter n=1 Tax=Fusobacterium TaxID=848 RepID=UPI00147695F9|nr:MULTISPECIES: chromate transporter [Fusobacterium]NME36657.1 chromate transporter [Fusobacterium sp. FSA-380-WT-3A]
MYLDLFISFFKIGLFSFGGGMGAIPLIQSQVVDINKWLTLTEFTDLITIAEMTPGPIAINSSTFVGMQTGGFLGAIVATAGCIMPACIIVFTLAWLYFKYKNLTYLQGILSTLRPAIVGLIMTAGFSIFNLAILTEKFNIIGFLLIVIGIILLRKFKFTPIQVMLGSGVVGGIFYYIGEFV